jgi:GAF domain-containing protein
VAVDTERLARAFVELADTLVDDFDVHDVLHVLVSRCVELFDVVEAGLLLVDDDGRLHVAMSSSERARLLELLQVQNDEGPCLECYRSGESVGGGRLDEATERWPHFVPAAMAEGFGTVLALPMRLRGQVIGALNLFGAADSDEVAGESVSVAQAMADVATIAILQDRLARERDLLAGQLRYALDSRVVIEQAKGVLSSRLDVSMQEAFEMIRSRARSTRRRLAEVSAEVVSGVWVS